eukprot:854202-Amorphochlora_amoeboformis.AAC.1
MACQINLISSGQAIAVPTRLRAPPIPLYGLDELGLRKERCYAPNIPSSSLHSKKSSEIFKILAEVRPIATQRYSLMSLAAGNSLIWLKIFALS